MKKITLLGIAFLMTIVTFAQTSSTSFGFKGGVNLANLNMNTGNADWRTGFNLGALAHLHVSPHFAVQPELMYSMQGAKLSDNNQIKIGYVNLPVLGQYMFANGLRVQTGPQLGYRLGKNSESGHTTELNNTYKNVDFSWSLGAGYLTRSGLGIDARYNHGINDISKNNVGVKNRVWQFGIFYQFGK